MAAVHSQSNIEADDDAGYDSGYDALDDSGSVTTSLKSSVYAFRNEHGRMYSSYKGDDGDALYPFPTDEEELDRLDLQHQMFRLVRDGDLFSAPLPKEVGNVLDVGTGTGIFAIEFADLHPDANVLGIDLAPVQPAWVPVNCAFEIMDANDPWDFRRKFDYIHCRALHMGVEERKLYKQCFDALNPGGWLEVQETPLPVYCDDGTLEGTALLKWTEEMLKLGQAINVAFDNAAHYADWIREAGFVNVQHITEIQPLNPWPKDPKLKRVGMWAEVVFRDGVEAFSLKLFADVLGWSPEELQVLLAQVRRDISDRKIHAYFKMHIVLAQKPWAA